MLRDVFYYGDKPNVHPREKPAKNLEDARQKATTEHFWIINEYCDYTNFDWDFDFDFLPDELVWTQDHNNIWPSQHCKDSGTWLCSKSYSDTFYYRTDVEIVKRKPIKTDNWKINEKIVESSFDFSWHPDPTDPPYIYKWGCRFYSSTYKSVIEYHVPGAINVKHMDALVELLPDYDNWKILHDIDKNSFDFSWRPDPSSPPYIYVWGNQHYPGTVMPTIEYHTENATERKYMDSIWYAKLLAQPNKFEVYEDISDFDFTWVPDPTSPPYIYVWGNQWNKPEDKASVIYKVEDATEYKYMDKTTVRKPCKKNWIIPNNINLNNFDFSWEPNPKEGKYIYQFGTQHQKTGGPKYIVEGATEIKYMDNMKVLHLPDKSKFQIEPNLTVIEFDYSWHPDESEDPYIYVFGNMQYSAEEMPTIKYVVEGAAEYKYVNSIKAKLAIKSECWQSPDNIDLRKFNFDWIPHPKDPPYIYEFGTQWQKTGGPKYVVPGATEIKYVDEFKSVATATTKNWSITENVVIESFDFSWHPDSTEKPYIYVFGNQHYPAEIMPTIQYVVPGATEIKYVNDIIAKLGPNRKNWIVPNNIDSAGFDFSWIPNPKDPAYVYEWNTQWQKNGGVKYIVDGATETKYMFSDNIKALPTNSNWKIANDLKIKTFDYSWHPDNTEKPYIYVFGNTQHKAEIMPTIQYVVDGATEIKYVHDIVATLDINMSNWQIPNNIDMDSFDFSWIPDPTSPPYIYEFATIWNNRGGPIYAVQGATEYKYITDICAKTKSSKNNWIVKLPIDEDSFDFSWMPHPESPPYIYVFGNQWNSAEKESTVEYHVPGATDYKYITNIVAKVIPNKSNFEILLPIEESSFDFSWRPDPYDEPYIYIFGNTQYPGKIMPTIRYKVKNATQEKFIDDIKAKLAPNYKYWNQLIPIDKTKFDFSWVPDPKSPPYIYVFGNQWNKASVEPTIEYRVPNATEYKYVDDIIGHVLPDKKKFKILHPIIEDSFDFSWRPNPLEDPYIYVFGNNQYPAEKMPTITYIVKDAVEFKYDNSFKSTLAQNYERFNEIIPIDRTSFDYSWVPDPHDPPYIYVWGNQWNDAEIEPTIEYIVEGATQRKFMTSKAKVLPNYDNWKELIKVKNFDYSWRPNPTSPAYIYVFGNQWHKAEKDPTIEYHVPGAIDKKYINDIVCQVAQDKTNWIVPENIDVSDFDFSWRPDPGNPPYIYQFGTFNDDNDGPRYVHPDNTGEVVRLLRVTKQAEIEIDLPKYYIKTTLEDLIKEHPDELFWALNKNINYSNFDFNWRPNIEQARYIQVFGSPEAIETQTYFVSAKMYNQGYTEFNYITEDIKAESEYLAELFVQPDIFMIDRGNIESQERFNKLKERFPTIQKTRYLNSWVDTIYRCLNKCNTQLAWILNSELDYTDFDFKYYPNPWQLKMVHVFGTQWSHWGTTYLVNKDTFVEDTKYVKIIEHLGNLNFVKGRTAKATNCLYDVYLIDHGNKETIQIKQQLQIKVKDKRLTIVPYRDSYLETFKDILSTLTLRKDLYIWVCNSICDYDSFDFSYICDPFAKDNLHVFPSDRQKFGDTFLIDVNKLTNLINDMNLLEDYEKVNYNQHMRTKRLPCPVIISNEDTNSKIKDLNFDFPYALVKTQDSINLDIRYDEPISLWAEHTKNIEILSTGATSIVVPKEAVQLCNYDAYDYPYITKSKKIVKSQPLDIVYLSNGEIGAEENYEHLVKITKHLPNRIVRVDGVNGRVQAYHAAAKASSTPWMFTVFAKLKVDEKFDWSWQPDRLQRPKHYIFNALNPVNGLIYGHQAMIAYNKTLVLGNEGKGLDFTLDDEHEVVDILSGTANFNTDQFSAWRTAFREVIKLKSDYKDISFERLNTWLTVANGPYSEECLLGSRDGVDYYDQVQGDPDQLKLSYEWKWLKEYYDKKYK